MATRNLLGELAALHESRTGRQVTLTAIGGVDAARRIRDGEQTDVVALAAGVMQALAAEGHILPNSLVPFAVSAMAVATPAGAARVDIATEAALRAAIRTTRAIGYSTGPSDDHLLQLVHTWGLQSEVAGRLVKAPPGTPVARLLANGDATLGFQQLSELLGQPGVEVLGSLPNPVQSLTTFTAGVAVSSQQPAAAEALIKALTCPEAAAAMQRYGMTPG